MLRDISGIYDNATGVYKLGTRYYNPAQGRFTQQDPSGQEQNPYTYAGNNPIKGSDPSGLDFWGDLGNQLIGRGIGYAVGSTFGAIAGIALSPSITPVGGSIAGVAIGGCISGAISTGTINAFEGNQPTGEEIGAGCASGAIFGGWLRAVRT